MSVETSILVVIPAHGGSKGIPRKNKELADDKTTLDPVIYHALKEMEREKYDIVLTSETLDKAIGKGLMPRAVGMSSWCRKS